MWAIVPLKDFVNAKQRLSGVLTAHQRRLLFQAMVEDVLTVLSQTAGVSDILIVSDDPVAAMLAQKYGAQVMAEDGINSRGLNGAVGCAARMLEQQGVSDVMIIHGDLPLLTTAEIEILLRQHQTPAPEQRFTIVPDRERLGSNCMLCSPPLLIPFQYGYNSFEKHCAAAKQKLVQPQVLELPGLALDVDYPEDLLAMISALGQESKSHTAKFLIDNDMAERLQSASDLLPNPSDEKKG